MKFRSWQEHVIGDDRFEEDRAFSVFPVERGFLVTIRSKFKDRQDPMDTFGHQEITFFVNFEQANDIAHVLLAHVWGQRLRPDPLSKA